MGLEGWNLPPGTWVCVKPLNCFSKAGAASELKQAKQSGSKTKRLWQWKKRARGDMSRLQSGRKMVTSLVAMTTK